MYHASRIEGRFFDKMSAYYFVILNEVRRSEGSHFAS